MKLLLLAAYIATIPVANWMIGHVGSHCIPQGPCVVPVGLGLEAPSGVLLIGGALLLRDFIQISWGRLVALAAILVGTFTSVALAPPALVAASGAAFLFSELADFAVFTPLRRRGLIIALLASCAVGALVDSVLFLWLAFGNLDFLAGQIVGKLWAVAAASLLIAARRRSA